MNLEVEVTNNETSTYQEETRLITFLFCLPQCDDMNLNFKHYTQYCESYGSCGEQHMEGVK